MVNNKIEKEFFFKDAKSVAKNLLGKVLVRNLNGKILRARIVETEAYFDENDPGSRAKQYGDLRETMLMPAGTILVYGIHNSWLINFVTNKEGIAEAVLIRALEPLNFNSNCSGPGLLTKSLAIDKNFHKKNISEKNDLWLEDEKEKVEIINAFRIGLKKDSSEKLRFYIKDNKFISKK